MTQMRRTGLALTLAASAFVLLGRGPAAVRADDGPPSPALSSAAFDADAQLLQLTFSGVVERANPRIEVDGRVLAVDPRVATVTSATGAVVIAVEASSSTAPAILAEEQAFARELVEALPAGVAVGIVAFGSGAREVAPLTTNRAETLRALASLSTQPPSALYEGVWQSAQLVAGASEPRSIVLLTYGWDFGASGKITRDSAIEAARVANAAVHTVTFGRDFDLPFFKALAGETGSVAIQRTDTTAKSTAARLASPLTQVSLPVILTPGQHRVRLVTNSGASELGFEVVASTGATTVSAEPIAPASLPQPVETVPVTVPSDARAEVVGTETPPARAIAPVATALGAVLALLAATSAAAVLLRRRLGRRRGQSQVPSLSNLRRAVSRGDMVLHYQLIRRHEDGEVVGAEALLRWRHAHGDPASARSFLNRAEAAGILTELTEHLVGSAAQTAATMRSAGFAKFQVSLNLSRAQLLDPGLIAAVRSSLERTGLPPDLLCFEVPEAVVLGSSRTAAIARELADAGVGLILDDFWAIAPDLLAGLPPIQSVKVDLNVVAGGRLDADIDRVASIARARRVPLVAKRVGSAEQLAFALEIGCEFFQGDGVSATVPAQDLVREAQTAALLFGAGAGPAPFFQDEEPAAA